MLEALALLLAFQLLGEALTHLGGLPLPGPVVGMALLFIAWPSLARWQRRLEDLATQLLSHFGLLFVPAGVGVMVHAHLLAQWWGPLLLAVLAGTVGTLVVGAWLMHRLSK
ncbi:MAG: CidA/LrgA family protein [Burkholderiales bacterium]|uniref:CidA/LrgA family protein n=1 Tax=Inhella sp. TaxID=1921806 RepID=UPI001ACD3CAE|nr:CidA/LrgA family protein [Burkholderiales bacterium]